MPVGICRVHGTVEFGFFCVHLQESADSYSEENTLLIDLFGEGADGMFVPAFFLCSYWRATLGITEKLLVDPTSEDQEMMSEDELKNLWYPKVQAICIGQCTQCLEDIRKYAADQR